VAALWAFSILVLSKLYYHIPVVGVPMIYKDLEMYQWTSLGKSFLRGDMINAYSLWHI